MWISFHTSAYDVFSESPTPLYEQSKVKLPWKGYTKYYSEWEVQQEKWACELPVSCAGLCISLWHNQISAPHMHVNKMKFVQFFG